MPMLQPHSLFLVASLACMAGCSSWQHAPGYADRESMGKEQYKRILGTHGFHTPEGDIRVSDIDVTSGGGYPSPLSFTAKRAFDVEYRNARAKCVAPEKDAPVALSCSITMGSETGPTWTADVGPGCTEGRVSETASTGDPQGRRYRLRTDILHVAGGERPSREVALLDDRGVVAFSDSPGGDLFVFTRRETKLGIPELITLVAVQTYASTLAQGQCSSRAAT